MPIRIIQVGMGGWGRDWMRRAVSLSQEFEPVAWVDAAPGVLELARKELSLPEEKTFGDLTEALAEVECDAVLVTANLVGHVPSALTALKAGKHVLVEKPFAPTVAEAREVVELAEQQQRIVMVSQNYRFFSAVQAAREIIRSGEMGAVDSVQLNFRRYDNSAPRGKHTHYEIWQPLLADMSIHHFDMMRYLLDQEPEQVFCQAWNSAWSNYTEEAAALALITFKNGTVVNYSGSWTSTGPQTHWGGEWRIECEKGEILLRSRDESKPEYLATRARDEQKEREIVLPNLVESDRLGSLHAFAQAIHTGKEPESSGRDNLQTLALMFATIEAAQKRVTVKL